jgi:hypothetical protein
MVAVGGKLAPSPVISMSSGWSAVVDGAIAPPISPALATSEFFFERCWVS